MARIITKELAEIIAGKLKAQIKGKRGAHDLFAVYYDGKLVADFGIRHGSEKDKGHDFIPRQLHISPREAKTIGQCTYDRDWYIAKLIEKKLIEDPNEKKKDDSANPPAS